MCGRAILFVLLSVTSSVICDEAKSGKDSYLMALDNSHKINLNSSAAVSRIAREDYSSSYQPSYDYNNPTTNYGAAPQPSYGAPPQPAYGAPQQPAYGPPKPMYGPPAPVYGPPMPMYGPPAEVNHGVPYLSPEKWLLNKFKIKFDLFTIAKILLKLVIFKKIVKFIALLCLLFFIPTLKHKHEHDNENENGGDNGDDYRRRSVDPRYDYDSRLNEVTKFALNALESFSIDNALYCPEENLLHCRFKRMFDVIDEQYPLQTIVRMYVPRLPSINGFYKKLKGDQTTEDSVDRNAVGNDQ